MRDIPTTYDQSKESKIYKLWEESGFFNPDNLRGEPYAIIMPPPNANGALHIGHALFVTLEDIMIRYARMRGRKTLWLPGTDHAGFETQVVFEKKLEKEGRSRFQMTREEFYKEVWDFVQDYKQQTEDGIRRLGASTDWSRNMFTLDPRIIQIVYETFEQMYRDGLIYRGNRICNWCVKHQTGLADLETEHEERTDPLYYIKYGPLTLATVRTETKFGDTALAVNPKDKRYREYVGKEFEIETLAGKRKMKVIADDVVDPKFGTGVIKVTPGHDFNDYEIGKRHNLPILQVINKSGRLTELAGKYAGMKLEEARQAMIPELRERGILVKEEDYVHNVAVCERCKSVVEPLISDEWFLKVSELADGAVKVIDDGKIKFLPKNYAKILKDWLLNIHDWCISRSLWWGHRIPVWYRVTEVQRDNGTKSIEVKVSLDSPGAGWVQDEQVLDTWFSSGLWPLSTLGWPFDLAQGKPSSERASLDPELAKYFPWDFEISAPEIKYLWIARMIMIANYFTGEVPFKTMFFHGMLRDLQGRKFSKSLGNGIDPMYLIAKWGVDATRMALYTYSIPGRDGRVSREILDERGKNFRNFATKIRNIARYTLELKPDSSVILSGSEESRDPSSTTHDDRWILDELEKVTKKVTNNLESLELHLAVDELYDFVWHKFADKYIEESKSERANAQPTLEYVLKQVLILLHPFMPFSTEEIYQKFEVKRKSIMLEEWPSASGAQ